MKIKLLLVGKTDDKDIASATEKYLKRLKHYIDFKLEVIPDLKNTKNLSQDDQKTKEGELILAKVDNADVLVLLDENGKGFNSVGFANYLQKKMNAGTRNLIFVVGGPYGFSEQVYSRANEKIALSKMTFSHQMVRLFFTEQVYRAMTILKNEPYHHQ